MTPIASRYAPHLLVLALLGLGLTFWLSGPREQPDPCRDPAALRASRTYDARGPLVQRDDLPPQTLQWDYGVYEPRGPHRVRVDFAIVRTYRTTPILLRPTTVGRKRVLPDRTELRWIGEGEGALPVHLLYEEVTRQPRMAAYFYVYDGEPVASPFRQFLRDGFEILWSGSKPLSMVMATAPTSERTLEATEAATLLWLQRAWKSYERSCRAWDDEEREAR